MPKRVSCLNKHEEVVIMSIKITKDKNAIIAVILYGLYGLFDFFAGTKDIVEISNSTWVLVLRLLLCSAFCFSILFEKRIAIACLSAAQILLSIVCIIFIDDSYRGNDFSFTVYFEIFIYWVIMMTMAAIYCESKELKYKLIGVIPAIIAVMPMILILSKEFESMDIPEYIVFISYSIIKIAALFFIGKWTTSSVTFSEDDSDNTPSIKELKRNLKPGTETRHLRKQDLSKQDQPNHFIF